MPEANANLFGTWRQTGGPNGYRAFFPNALPRRIDLSPAVVTRLAEAEAALGRLAGAGRLLPNPHLLVRPYIRREAVASARIEGTQATLPELFDLEALGGEPSPDLEEVLNYIRALETGIARLATLPISARLVTELHAVLLDGVRGRERNPGEFRRSQNWIGAPGATVETATFVPPPPDALTALLSDWEQFTNSTPTDLPLLVHCGLVHYQFETIHPFLDGNGRLGRLLIVFFLVAKGRLPSPILYLSPYFETHRDEYYERLQAVREHADIDGWLTFFLRAVEIQANDAVARAEQLVDLREEYRRRVLEVTRSQALALVDVAFDTPVLTSRLVEMRLEVTRPTALKLLRQLASVDILQEQATGRRRQRRWVATEILQAVTGATR